ncbi:hypothetical protein R4O66_004430 [Salmonella enterica]|nr:hypothetical protein [Salmonella enterica]ELR6878510.1 hypothetical protein [Salmonella enterica]
MSTLIRINVTNNSPFLHTFFFFQQPSVYTGGSEVFSNSLLSTAILPAAQGGAVFIHFYSIFSIMPGYNNARDNLPSASPPATLLQYSR